MSSFAVLLAAGTGGAQGGSGVQLLFMAGIVLVFWLFMLCPQAKKAKEQKNFVNNIQKGDKVVTSSGIYGSINKINEDGTIQLEVSPGSYIRMDKSAINMDATVAINKANTPASTK